MLKIVCVFWYTTAWPALLMQLKNRELFEIITKQQKQLWIMAEVMENMHHEYASKGKANAGLTLGRQK